MNIFDPNTYIGEEYSLGIIGRGLVIVNNQATNDADYYFVDIEHEGKRLKLGFTAEEISRLLMGWCLK